MIDLRAEAAADIGRDDAQLVLRQMQHEGAHQQADGVRILAGGEERVVAGAAVILADIGARLHGVGHKPVVDEVKARDVLRLGEGGVDRGLVADMPVIAEIARRRVPDARLARPHRVLDRGGGRERLVADSDQLRRFLRLRPGSGDDHRDGIADVADALDGEDRVRRLGHGRAVLRLHAPAAGQGAHTRGLQIGARIDGDDAGRRLGARRVDALDLGMGMRAAQEHRVQLARPVDVVGVVALAGEEAEILLSAHRRADRGGHFPLRCIASVPALMALTIL